MQIPVLGGNAGSEVIYWVWYSNVKNKYRDIDWKLKLFLHWNRRLLHVQRLKLNFAVSEADQRPSITFLFWRAEYFHHFHYLYNLARDCEYRVVKLKQSRDLANRMPEDVVIKLGIVGNFTKDNEKLISKRSGSDLPLDPFMIK